MASNDFEQSQRNTIWTKYFGSQTSGVDAFGRTVSKQDFHCDHVYPKAKYGKTIVENGIPLHPESNREKDDNLSGIVNGKKFDVQGTKSRGILIVSGIIKTK